MEAIFNDVCILVTAAFVLTLVPGFRQPERSLLSGRDKSTALLVFLILGLVEEATASHDGWINERIVAVCAAGLVAGPWVGFQVSVFVTWLAVGFDGLPFGSIGLSMLGGGLAAGWLYRWRPMLAQHPVTGFCLTWAISLLRSGLTFMIAPNTQATLDPVREMVIAPVLEGLGTALILAIVGQVREHDRQTRAAAEAEVRALQARMNPHFLFNALNSIAALSVIAPAKIPPAAGRLRHFLRASFEQPERALVPLEEELAVVSAYLQIETLRFGGRLNVDLSIDPGLSGVLIPPFSLQPLVENGVHHGLDSTRGNAHLRLLVRSTGSCLEMSVSDDGEGMQQTEVEKVFFAERQQPHAMVLLRRRLEGLFGRSFQFLVRSEIGQGTTVTLQIPVQRQFGSSGESPVAIARDFHELASQ
jgi:two-component system LytT family sensor kinase